MSLAISTNDLRQGERQTPHSTRASRQFIRLAWQTIYSKYQKLTDLLRRETNRPLPKELRRSLRLNKSAKRKGYQQHQSEADKRALEEHLNQPINLAIRIGPAFEYMPSNS
ncbi:uncharacterized protein LOC115623982 [Scaptodrosophila lebanonensis]|uniref:Uncharacterized protein LOC115623982 n=1 Tax=Drosophila lebanonensis TaxID=7225 RepID=A0A6J2TH37_DROLE|nr:uncharacterized protein LOC115623982 [Scaptodrosophila lebanonensis]